MGLFPKKKNGETVMDCSLRIFPGADRRTRTADPRITNALLYQLSHIGKTECKGKPFF